MECFDMINISRRFSGEMFNLRKLELDCMKAHLNEVKNGKLGNQEVDDCYALFATIEQTTVVTCEDKFQNENGKEDGNENVHKKDEDGDKDPQYCMFMENLTENGKSYKLKISKTDEEPRFLYYEEPRDSDWCDDLQTCIDNSGNEVTGSEDMQMNQKPKRRRVNEKKREVSAKKEVSRKKKINNHKPGPLNLPGADDDYLVHLNSCIRPKHGAVTPEDELVEHEKNAITSDSDVAMWGMQMNPKPKRRLNEQKREVSAKEEASRRKKLNNRKPGPLNLQDVDDEYWVHLNSCIRPKDRAVTHEDELVEHEKNATSSDSDVAKWGMQMNQKPKRRLNEQTMDSAIKEVSRRKNPNNHESTTLIHQCNIDDPPYQWFLNNIPSVYREVNCEELMEHEKNATTSDSDSAIIVLDNVHNCREVNIKQEKLKEKLMQILKQPYNEKEHEELSGYIEEQKPICRLLPLRGRSISSAVGGVKKSVLDHGPGSFRWMYNAAHNDPPKALNLLRMFRFWLEHVPDEDMFDPWKDKRIREVRPSEKSALNS